MAVHEPKLYAVYDGHGGGEASAIAAAELFEQVLASEGFARGDGEAALLAGLAATPTTRRNLRSSPYPARGTSQPSTPNLSHTLDGMVIARSQSNTLDDFVLNNLPRSPLSGPSLAAARRHPPGYPSPSASAAPASPAQRSGGGGGGALGEG